MANPSINYFEVDYSGNSPANKIKGEQHVLNSKNANQTRDHRIIVPRFAPFFANRSSVSDRLQVSFVNPSNNQKRILVEGKDYYLTHLFIEASKACARPIWGSIEILDDSLNGIIVFDYYQTLGGKWNITEDQITLILADKLYNPRRTSWEQVVDVPETFPTVDHEWNLVDLYGASDLVEALNRMRDAVALKGDSAVIEHITDKENPHEVTKKQVGLDKVENYPVSTKKQAEDATSNVVYMTPVRTMDLVNKHAVEKLDEHEKATNPHGITPQLIGAGTKTEVDGKLGKNETAQNADRVYGLNKTELTVDILKGTAANADKIGGKTIEELRNTVLAGEIENAIRLDGKTLDEIYESLEDVIEEQHIVVSKSKDTEKFDGKTYTEVTADILSGTADNASKLSGKTITEIYTEVATASTELMETTVEETVDELETRYLKPKIYESGYSYAANYHLGSSRYYDVYNFDVTKLTEQRLPSGSNTSYNHSFIMTAHGFDTPENAAFLVNLVFSTDTTKPTTGAQADLVLTIKSASVTALTKSAIKPRLYLYKKSNTVMTLVMDKQFEYRDFEFYVSAFSVTNLSAFAEFFTEPADIVTIGTDTFSATGKTKLAYVTAFINQDTIEGVLTPNQATHINRISPEDKYVIYVQDTRTEFWYSSDTTLTTYFNEFGLVIINERPTVVPYKIHVN